MPTQIYKTTAGVRVPGVTTILGNLGWNRRQLMIWANRLGLEGTALDSPEAKKAAEVGTLAHALGESWIRGGCDPALVPPEPKEAGSLEHQAWQAFQSLPRWWAQQSMTVVGAEVAIVSDTMKYGGTMDLVAQGRDGSIVVIDFKTGKDVYTEMLLQLAAYGALWHEKNPHYNPPAFALLRWGRDGDFHHHHYPQLRHAWEAFQHALALHDLHKKLTK